MADSFTSKDFDQTEKAVQDAFSSLYLIDVASLTTEQKQKHFELLNAAYEALLAMENADFAKLGDRVLASMPDIKKRAEGLQDKLAGLKKANQVISIVAGAVDLFSDIVALL